MPTKDVVLKYLKHLGVLVGLSAASIVLVNILQVVGTLNVQTLPTAYQGIAYLLLPVIVASGQKVKDELDKELAQQQAAKAIAELNVQKGVNLAVNHINSTTPGTADHS
jgi:uncharacterized membrane-anchored protein